MQFRKMRRSCNDSCRSKHVVDIILVKIQRKRMSEENVEVRHVVARATRHEHIRETRAILEATVPAVTQ